MDLNRLRRDHGYIAVADGYFMTCLGNPCSCGASAHNELVTQAQREQEAREADVAKLVEAARDVIEWWENDSDIERSACLGDLREQLLPFEKG